jgi:asparagine N-glycosylation enzyme membrane subunit Stt3
MTTGWKVIYGLVLVAVFLIVTIAVASLWKEVEGEDLVNAIAFGMFCGAVAVGVVDFIFTKYKARAKAKYLAEAKSNQ